MIQNNVVWLTSCREKRKEKAIVGKSHLSKKITNERILILDAEITHKRFHLIAIPYSRPTQFKSMNANQHRLLESLQCITKGTPTNCTVPL
jgi:hypothetical protein